MYFVVLIFFNNYTLVDKFKLFFVNFLSIRESDLNKFIIKHCLKE